MSNQKESMLFAPYSIEVKKFLEKTLFLSSYPTNNNLIGNVAVYYSTPSRVFTKFLIPRINGGALNPIATFNLQSHQNSPNQMVGGYTTRYKEIDREKGSWAIESPLLPYELVYRVTMWTAKQSEMDILVYQVLTAAPFNKKYSVLVNGQWAEFEVKNANPESNVDPGEAQDVSVRYGFDIVVPRAYLQQYQEEYYGTIKITDVLYDI